MRKKDILGNYVKRPGVIYTASQKKLCGEFEGYSALINFLPGTRRFNTRYNDKEYCLSDEGYKWLMYLPMNENWCITAFYDREENIIEWYFDISKGNFLDENGMPCTDDIFLDLIIMADGHSFTIDGDELQEALDKNEITSDDFNFAYEVRDSILSSKWNDVKLLNRLCETLLSDY